MEENDILIKNVANVDSIKQPNDDYDSCECSTDDYISELKTTISESENKYTYLLAEFDNYKKRTNKEKLLMHSQGVEETVLAILPVLDDFERAFEHNELAEGGKLIYKKLISTLENIGLEKIHIDEETNFNTDEHEAIDISFTGDKGKINQVVLPGYKLNGKIIRYAKVVVG